MSQTEVTKLPDNKKKKSHDDKSVICTFIQFSKEDKINVNSTKHQPKTVNNASFKKPSKIRKKRPIIKNVVGNFPINSENSKCLHKNYRKRNLEVSRNKQRQVKKPLRNLKTIDKVEIVKEAEGVEVNCACRDTSESLLLDSDFFKQYDYIKRFYENKKNKLKIKHNRNEEILKAECSEVKCDSIVASENILADCNLNMFQNKKERNINLLQRINFTNRFKKNNNQSKKKIKFETKMYDDDELKQVIRKELNNVIREGFYNIIPDYDSKFFENIDTKNNKKNCIEEDSTSLFPKNKRFVLKRNNYSLILQEESPKNEYDSSTSYLIVNDEQSYDEEFELFNTVNDNQTNDTFYFSSEEFFYDSQTSNKEIFSNILSDIEDSETNDYFDGEDPNLKHISDYDDDDDDDEDTRTRLYWSSIGLIKEKPAPSIFRLDEIPDVARPTLFKVESNESINKKLNPYRPSIHSIVMSESDSKFTTAYSRNKSEDLINKEKIIKENLKYSVENEKKDNQRSKKINKIKSKKLKRKEIKRIEKNVKECEEERAKKKGLIKLWRKFMKLIRN